MGCQVKFSPQWTIHQFCIVVMTNYRHASHKYILIRAVALPRLSQSQEGILLCTQHNSLVTEELTLKDLFKVPQYHVIFSVVLFAWSYWIFP